MHSSYLKQNRIDLGKLNIHTKTENDIFLDSFIAKMRIHFSIREL